MPERPVSSGDKFQRATASDTKMSGLIEKDAGAGVPVVQGGGHRGRSPLCSLGVARD